MSKTFKILRYDPVTEAAPHFETFIHAPNPADSVLETLKDIRDSQDPSLAFRYSCREAVCGSCAIVINGAISLACRTQVDQLNTALIVIEHMLGCDTEACIIPEPKLLQVFDYRKRDTTGEVAVSRPPTAAETARMILSYAQQTAAGAIRLRAVEGNIWVRFLSQRSHLDLVFEVAAR